MSVLGFFLVLFQVIELPNIFNYLLMYLCIFSILVGPFVCCQATIITIFPNHMTKTYNNTSTLYALVMHVRKIFLGKKINQAILNSSQTRQLLMTYYFNATIYELKFGENQAHQNCNIQHLFHAKIFIFDGKKLTDTEEVVLAIEVVLSI